MEEELWGLYAVKTENGESFPAELLTLFHSEKGAKNYIPCLIDYDKKWGGKGVQMEYSVKRLEEKPEYMKDDGYFIGDEYLYDFDLRCSN
jgi:hypothetical protein